MRTITSLVGNSQRLDGGAMFGNAPQALWRRWIEPDSENRIPLACRCFLIEDGGRKILLETGIGAFFDDRYKERYGVIEGNHVLLDSLSALGISHEQIDVVVLSHLHFDHAGGMLSAWEANKDPVLLFPNAHYLVSQQAWERACNPHARDRASFIPVLEQELKKSKRLELVTKDTHPLLGEGYRFHFSQGHTPGLMLTEVDMLSGPAIFAGDLIPGRHWVHIPITMGYDRFPELLIDEKKKFLQDLLLRNGRLLYTHDADFASSHVQRDDRGRFSAFAPVATLHQCTN